MVEKGEKLFLVTRRLFETDLRRHFVGEVMEVSSATVRVRGYAFVFDDVTKEFVRRIDLRTRIFSLIDAGVMVSILPQEVILKDIRYSFEDGSRILTDGKLLKMNVSEFGATR